MAAPELLTSALADRYRIERELGRGGMASAYLADDLKHGRKVAIKVLRPELAATIGQERFLREIEIAARLTHPHIDRGKSRRYRVGLVLRAGDWAGALPALREARPMI